MNDQTAEWLRYAGENLRSAEILFASKLFNPCLQNIQQAVEKMLKAVLVERSVAVKRTHRIGELVAILSGLNVSVPLSGEDCDVLDSIYVPSKYPSHGVLPGFEPDEQFCRRCLDIAMTVNRSITELLQNMD